MARTAHQMPGNQARFVYVLGGAVPLMHVYAWNTGLQRRCYQAQLHRSCAGSTELPSPDSGEAYKRQRSPAVSIWATHTLGEYHYYQYQLLQHSPTTTVYTYHITGLHPTTPVHHTIRPPAKFACHDRMMKKTRINKSRSRKGCLTCRQRHIKCDEAIPVCKNCRRSNRACERGCRFNFLKSITFRPETPDGLDYSDIKFMDHSLSIHKLYRCNNFHDYSTWLSDHSKQELKESDADIRDGETANETPGKRYTKPRSATSNSNYNSNSDSDTSRQSSGTPTPFNLVEFVTKVLSISRNTSDENQSMFVYNQQEPLMRMISGGQMTPAVNDKLILRDLTNLTGRLEAYALDESTGQENFQIEYTILLNALNLCVKSGVLELFNPTYASSNIIYTLYQLLSIENWGTIPSRLALYESVHNYGNLMNFYELMLLDLNESLKHNKPNAMRTDDDAITFMFDKILTLNLFDDLNYSLIRMTIILLKLNNLRHHRHRNPYELEQIIKDLKDLESNQFFTAYYPQAHDESSFSSASSTGSISQRTSTTFHTRLGYANMKARRAHLYYNFILCYILRHFPLTNNARNMLQTPTFLNIFWNHQEVDVFQRLAHMTNDTELSSDPFMNFLRR